MSRMLKSFFDDRSGATAIEYSLIASFIAIALYSSAQAVGLSVSNVFTSVTPHLK